MMSTVKKQPRKRKSISKKNKSKGSIRSTTTLKPPVSMQKIVRSTKPQFTSIADSSFYGDGAIRVSHREYITDILGSIAYANTTLSINPGLSGTFPWLATSCALGYESYTFEKLDFFYEPMCSTATSGKVILAIDFDATDTFPDSKVTISSYHNAVSVPPWAEGRYVSDRRDLVKMAPQRYIRQGTILTALNDLKTFDVGNLQIGVQGMSGTTTVGELWVEYTVILQTPQTNPAGSLGSFSAKVTGGGTVSRSAPFGTAAVIAGSLGVTASGSTLTFPNVGQYIVDMVVTGTGLSDGASPVIGGTGTESTVIGEYSGGSTAASFGAITNITLPGQTFSVDYTTAATSVDAAVARISPYLYSLG